MTRSIEGWGGGGGKAGGGRGGGFNKLSIIRGGDLLGRGLFFFIEIAGNPEKINVCV